VSQAEARPYIAVTLGDGTTSHQAVSWSVSRSLSGSGLPGQVRVTSGTGSASGSVDVTDVERSTPWDTGSGAVVPGSLCQIVGTTDYGVVAQASLLRGVIREVSMPGIFSTLRSLSIEDDLARLQRPLWLPTALIPGLNVATDAAYIIDAAARTGGRYATAPAGASTLISFPLQGSFFPEVGVVGSVAAFTSWGTVAGRIVPTGLTGLTANIPTTPLTTKILVSAVNVSGDGAIDIRVDGTLGLTTAYVKLRMSGGSLQASRDGGSTWTTIAPGGSVGVGRFEVEITWTSTTAVSLRTRYNGPGGTGTPVWPGAVTLTGTAVTSPTNWTSISIGGGLTGVQVNKAEEPGLWTLPTAKIAASGSDLRMILLPKAITAVDALQQVSASTDAAWWIDEDGVLVYLPRTTLAAQSSTGTLSTTTSLADIPASTSTDDLVDRVEVTFSPPVLTSAADYSLGVFEATDVIEVAAGATVVQEYDLDTSVGTLATWAREESGADRTLSRWWASTAPVGGTKVAASGVTISSSLLNPRRIRITIKNNTGATIWMVDGNGDPHVIVRAMWRVSAGEQQTAYAGATLDDARYPATLDLGAYVQTATRAQAIADSLMTALATPMPVLTGLQVYPSPSRHLGDVVTLSDPITGLSCRGVICKIDNSGSAGSWQQTIDLAVLAYL